MSEANEAFNAAADSLVITSWPRTGAETPARTSELRTAIDERRMNERDITNREADIERSLMLVRPFMNTAAFGRRGIPASPPWVRHRICERQRYPAWTPI